MTDQPSAAAGDFRISTGDADISHSLTPSEVLGMVGSSSEGLTGSEAAARLAALGPNELPRSRPGGFGRILLRQFKSPLIYILLIAALVALVLGDITDAAFIVVVLLVNATIGATQESRAESSADSLRSLVTARARVIRDGEEREVEAAEIVPGDIVVLDSGVKVPADLRLVSGGLQIDEALLTGESLPVAKRADLSVGRDAPLAERPTMAYAGTMVAKGRAYGVAVATAGATQLGRIASSLASVKVVAPPLLQRMDRFTKNIAWVMGASIVAVAMLSLARGASAHEVFVSSVALAVAAIPEGLPVAMTIALAIAVRRMSRRNVIARRLAAVEALGSCTFIASDKTGTLTMNQLRVRRVLIPGCEPIAIGDSPEGVGVGTACPSALEAPLERLCAAAALCNDGTLVRRDGEWISHGDAVDVALLALAEAAGQSRAVLESEQPRIASIPFEAERQFAASVNASPSGARVFVKGAAEKLIRMCTRVSKRDGEDILRPREIETDSNALAAEGFRVLAIAEGVGRILPDGEVDPDCLRDLVLLGFVGMIDPLRPEAKDAIKACTRAGIDVAMVTGDHPVTAFAIATELGLAADRDQIVTGPRLEAAAANGSAAVDEIVRTARVFARIEPRQKLEIVEALERVGHFVAVTGDGANDAPAMKAAHIGVSMGKTGTDVARETGELILIDDNFASIVAGIEEGRIAYANVRKVIFLAISTGAAELLLFALCVGFGLPPPLFALQLLWLNLVTNGIQDVALAFEPGEGDELDRPPRSPREPIFDRLMVDRILISAIVIGGIGFLCFKWMLDRGWAVDEARNALLLLIVLFENVQAGNARSERRSLLTLAPWKNPLLFVGTACAQLLHIGAMYTPVLRDVLDVSPVSLELWLVMLGLAMFLFVALELEKLMGTKRNSLTARS